MVQYFQVDLLGFGLRNFAWFKIYGNNTNKWKMGNSRQKDKFFSKSRT